MKIRAAMLRCLVILLALPIVAYIVEARFPQPHEEYQARRAKLRAAVDGPVVIYGYTGNEDTSEYAIFFQEPNFYYLSGHTEPGAALVLIPSAPAGKATEGPHEILYLPVRNLGQEKWEGAKIGPDDPGVAAKTGFEKVEPLANLKGDLEKLAKTYSNFYTVLPPKHEEGYPHFTESAAKIRAAVPVATMKDIAPALYAMRQVKSAGELALLQKAIDLSVDAHIDAFKQMHPGVFEYQIAARMKQIHEWGGCSREAYGPIVGAGFNSTVLHYSSLDNEIKDGDLVVIDVGGEYGGYAADITRTMPANGKFTPRQREIYEIVLAAQNAAIATIKPGARLFSGPESAMVRELHLHQHARQGQRREAARKVLHSRRQPSSRSRRSRPRRS